VSPPAPIVLPHHGVWPEIAGDAFVAPGVFVAGEVTIGSETGIWPGCVLRGDVNFIRIGARTNIQDATVIHVSGKGAPTVIGDEVTIGHHCLIHACTLQDRSFVGMRATVMDNAVVETGAMVAAGALVTPGKRVPAGELWAGSPAKKMRDLSADEIAGFQATIDRYVNHARVYRETIAGL
jgi:carbonic anhydrase/acetyltransferase-like protein (isoleucine patch superfamily)